MMAEATGVFFYVFPGIASVASFTLATTNPVAAVIGVGIFGSLFQIGWAFAIGIAFAIIVSCFSLSHPGTISIKCLNLMLTLL
jgi:hypothetical protein